MKILTFSNCDLVASQGSGYVILNFARGLASRGHAVTLIGPRECMVRPHWAKARSFRLALGLWLRIARRVRAAQPDVIEFWGAESCWAVAWLARQSKRRFRIVARSNGVEPNVRETLARHGLQNYWSGARSRWYQGRLALPLTQAFSLADAVVTVSEADAEYVVHRKLQPANRVLHIDNALSRDFLGQPFEPERPKTIGYCGSWVAGKGTVVLTAAMAEVLRAEPDWRLQLVGVGDDFRIESHFPAEVRSRVSVVGFIYDKAELRRVYQSWRIALMTSYYESFGLAAAEAMASGCALVATRTGFAASLRNEQEVRLIEPDPSQLRAAVAGLIRDDEARRRLARGGWRRVQDLSWERSTSELEAFYRRLLAET